MNKQENKSTYFSLRLNLNLLDEGSNETVEECMDIIFKFLTVKNECYAFELNNKTSKSYFFKTEERKRPAQIRKILDSNLPQNIVLDYQLYANTKQVFNESVKRFDINEHWSKYREPFDSLGYDGSDLEIFNNKSNFYPWQIQIYDMIFDSNGNIRDADDRKIITIVDKEGKKGKSSFVKYLCWGRLGSISKLGFGSATQLRSSIIAGGEREVYIIDIPRTRGRSDSVVDLLSVIEEVKNGFLTSPMYGKSKTLMMRPPFVLVFSNFHLPYDKLSQDRWDCYTISQNQKKPKLKSVSLKQFYLKQKVKK